MSVCVKAFNLEKKINKTNTSDPIRSAQYNVPNVICKLFSNKLRSLHQRLLAIPGIQKISLIILFHIQSKLWERLFLTRLKVFINECELIPTHQFGFRKSHSTIEQVHRMYHSIRLRFDRVEYTYTAFWMTNRPLIVSSTKVCYKK